MAASIGLRRVHTVAGDFALPRPDWPSGLKCILVDLSPSEAGEQQREACAAQLRQCAYDVTCASTVEHALEALGKGSFDVLLADAAALTSSKDDRLRKFVKQLPTIMICECPRPEEVMQSIKLGVAEVLERPLCPLKLKNIWQHSVRRIMRSASQQVLQHAGGPQQRIKAFAAGGRSASQELRTQQQQANSQNGSSTAPELSFCPVTPATTTADGAKQLRAAAPPSRGADSHDHHSAPDLAPAKPGSPMSCGTTPNLLRAPAPRHEENSSSGNALNDLTTATSPAAARAAVNVHESALYAQAPTTPTPASALQRAGSNNSGTLGSSGGAARVVLGVKRKSKDMSRTTTGIGAADTDAAAQQAQQQHDELDVPQPPPARRASTSLDAPAAGATPVVSGDDLLAPFGSLMDDLLAMAAAPAAAAAQPDAATPAAAPPPAVASAAAQHAMGPAVGLPAGMTWGMPLNPAAVAPGITPPIFPVPAGPVMPHPLAPSLWPAAPGMPPAPTPGCPMGPGGAVFPNPMAGMFNPMMAMMPPAATAAFNPMMPPGYSLAAAFGGHPMMPGAGAGPAGGCATPQLPPLPMSMLMGACGGGMDAMQQQQQAQQHMAGACGAAAYGGWGAPGACGMGQAAGPQGVMVSPCSPTPTDPSIMNSSHLSEHSVHDVLGMGGYEAQQQQQQHPAQQQHGHGMGGKATMAHHGGKMGRCESHQLLPSLLDDLMGDGDTDMDLELETLTLAAELAAPAPAAAAANSCRPPAPGAAGRGAPQPLPPHGGMRRNDSLDDLIGSAVAAF